MKTREAEAGCRSGQQLETALRVPDGTGSKEPYKQVESFHEECPEDGACGDCFFLEVGPRAAHQGQTVFLGGSCEALADVRMLSGDFFFRLTFQDLFQVGL